MSKGRPLRIALVGMPIVADAEEKVLNGLLAYAQERGGWRYVFSSEATMDAIRFLPKVKCDGAVVRILNAEMALAARKIQLPMVNISTWLANPGIPTVCIDNERVGQLAAEHFLKRGFRRFASVVCPGGWFVRHRSEAFVRAVGKSGFSCSTHAIKAHQSGLSDPQQLNDNDRQQLRHWLSSLKPQVGLFWTEDHLGHEVIAACQSIGLRVPQDVAIVSAPNRSSFCENCSPTLTSVDADTVTVGYTAALWLDRLIAGQKMESGQVMVPPLHLVARKSSETFAADNEEVARSLNYIYERIGSGINASDVVNNLNLSRRTFYRIFQDTTGQSPKQFIQSRRVAMAVEMILKESDLSLQEIARRCGFRDRNRMNTVIVRETGQKPAELRAIQE